MTPKVTGSARKTYDAKTTVPAGHTLGIGLTGVLSGDASSVKASASFSFASAAAGEKTVVATGIKLASSGSARFYKLSATTARGEVGSIDKATLPEAAREATLKAGVSGDSCTLELSDLVPSDAGGKATYKVSNFTKNGLASASVSGSGRLTLTAKSAAENATDEVRVIVGGMANYADRSVVVTVSYSARPVASVSIASAGALTYTGKAQTGYASVRATWTDEEGREQVYSGPWDVSYEGVTRGGAAYGPTDKKPVDAGEYTVTISVPQSNPDLRGSASRTFTVSPAKVTISARSEKITLGDKMPEFGYDVSGLLSGDELARVPHVSCAATGDAAGVFIISVSGADAGPNYTVAYAFGKLTIEKALEPEPEPEPEPKPEPEPDPEAETITMYRLYNRWTGEHFYTASAAERDSLKNVGWTYEGTGWTAPAKGDKVLRLYNPYVEGGDHHYTLDEHEYNAFEKLGWRREGLGWYSAPKGAADSVPIHRQYNPYAETGTHNYTPNKSESDHLVSLGWEYEGVGWYGVSTER